MNDYIYKYKKPSFDVSLHHKHISGIYEDDYSVVFELNGGFDIIENEETKTTEKSFVIIDNCSFEDFSCFYIKRRLSKRNSVLSGKTISLKSLSKKIKAMINIKMQVELYGENTFYWQLQLFESTDSKKFPPQIVIMLNKKYTIRYVWE